MAWTYSDWRGESTVAARKARLALHLQEVADALTDRKVAVGADGKSMSKEQLQGYYNSLDKKYDEMSATGAGLMKIRRG